MTLDDFISELCDMNAHIETMREFQSDLIYDPSGFMAEKLGTTREEVSNMYGEAMWAFCERAREGEKLFSVRELDLRHMAMDLYDSKVEDFERRPNVIHYPSALFDWEYGWDEPDEYETRPLWNVEDFESESDLLMDELEAIYA